MVSELGQLICRYEKKEGKKSKWYEYIKELDQQRARGQQGAKSPLLWEAREVEQYLAGSPVQADIRARLQVCSPVPKQLHIEGSPDCLHSSDQRLCAVVYRPVAHTKSRLL